MKNLHDVLDNFKTTFIFLLLVILATVLLGTVHLSVKQVYRSNANDPQVEVVEQVSGIIKQDIPLDAIIGQSEQIDLATNLGLFVMIFDKDKKMVGSSMTLDGQVPTPPDSAFEGAKQPEGNRFTWQPKDDVRVAAVFKAVDDKGYVLAGRSLKEVESREIELTRVVVIGWVISVVISLLLSLVPKPRGNVTLIEETNVTVVE